MAVGSISCRELACVRYYPSPLRGFTCGVRLSPGSAAPAPRAALHPGLTSAAPPGLSPAARPGRGLTRPLHPALRQDRFLHRKVVLAGIFARLLGADDAGHVGGVGDVAFVLRETHLLVPLAEAVSVLRQGDPGFRVVQRLDVE